MRLSQGERGKQGDHGQDGGQGLRGAKGERGEKGGPTRAQVLVAFLLLALFCISTAYWQSTQTRGLKRAQRAAFVSCRAIEAGNAQFNKVLDQLARNAQASTALTPAQKQQALATYASIHLPKLNCAGLAP